jgi:hypothetical protein
MEAFPGQGSKAFHGSNAICGIDVCDEVVAYPTQYRLGFTLNDNSLPASSHIWLNAPS